MAHGRVSDKSRHFSFLALQELERISGTHPICPDPATLGEEQAAWLNERMRGFHESVVRTGYRRFSFLHHSKEVRNSLAHSTSDCTKEELSALWSRFYGFMDRARHELEANIDKSHGQDKEVRQFEKFGSPLCGSGMERKALAQSLQDALDTSLPEEQKLPFRDSAAACELQKFLEPDTEEAGRLLDFARGHGRLCQQIQGEMLSCLDKAYRDTELGGAGCPFSGEATLVQSLGTADPKSLLEGIEGIRESLSRTETGGENTCDFDFFQRQLQSVEQDADQHQLEILARNLTKDLRNSLEERYLAWQLAEIDRRRREYLAELYQKIGQFKKLEELLSPFTQEFGRLWDMSSGQFHDYGFELLRDFADLLERDQSLLELAELLGKQATEVARYERELRDKIEIRTEYHPRPAYRGQISGLQLGGEISSALPSELALYSNPATRLYFAQKFAEKKLLSYAYVQRQGYSKEERTSEEVEVAIEEGKGPVIICVDTSGSMQGVPERVAKTITFALTKKCLEEERGCYLISFSTGIEVQDMSLFKRKDGLGELIQFLRKSFNGGTDVAPALRHGLELMGSNDWKRADLLLVSDFVMDQPSGELVDSIRACQKDGTRFFSLVIGDSGNKETISCFDENWSYDSSARGGMARLVRQMERLYSS